MSAEPKRGDKVAWNTPQGETTGTVKKKLTADEKKDLVAFLRCL